MEGLPRISHSWRSWMCIPGVGASLGIISSGKKTGVLSIRQMLQRGEWDKVEITFQKVLFLR